MKNKQRSGQRQLTNVEFAAWLSNELGESESRDKFHLWSAVCIIGQAESTLMLDRAKMIYESDKSRPLGGLWYSQMPEKSDRVMYRFRQGIREFMNLEPHSVPEVFE